METFYHPRSKIIISHTPTPSHNKSLARGYNLISFNWIWTTLPIMWTILPIMHHGCHQVYLSLMGGTLVCHTLLGVCTIVLGCVLRVTEGRGRFGHVRHVTLQNFHNLTTSGVQRRFRHYPQKQDRKSPPMR